MPKFVYTAAKGIEQQSGSGFIVQDVPVIEDSETVSTSTACATYGVTLLEGDITATLDSGVYAGQIKTFISTSHAGSQSVDLTDALTVAGGAASELTFSATGEAAQLIWNGDNWNVLTLTGSAAVA